MRRRDTRKITGFYDSLDIRWLHREGLLKSQFPTTVRWYRENKEMSSIQVVAQNGQVLLNYDHSRRDGYQSEHLSYPVRVRWTSCNYGGIRPWFICPTPGCGRRVAILYAGRMFACRHCYNLAYESQRIARHSRAIRRARKIRMKLGGTISILDAFPGKPRRMHWRTYTRLFREYEVAKARSAPEWMTRIGLSLDSRTVRALIIGQCPRSKREG